MDSDKQAEVQMGSGVLSQWEITACSPHLALRCRAARN